MVDTLAPVRLFQLRYGSSARLTPTCSQDAAELLSLPAGLLACLFAGFWCGFARPIVARSSVPGGGKAAEEDASGDPQLTEEVGKAVEDDRCLDLRAAEQLLLPFDIFVCPV